MKTNQEILNLNIQHLSEWCNIISHRLFLKKNFQRAKAETYQNGEKVLS